MAILMNLDSARSRFVVLGVLTFLGALWRLLLSGWIVPAWEASINVTQFPDDYPALAHSLLHRFTLGYGPGAGAEVTTIRGPAFPAWLAVGILLGGSSGSWLGFWSSVPILVTASVLACRTWARFGPASGVVTHCFLVFHPLPSVLSSRVMSDEFFASCGIAAVLIWAKAQRLQGLKAYFNSAVAGLALSVQMLTRATGLLFLVSIVLVSLIWRANRKLLFVVAVCALIPPLLWSIRSSWLEGRPVFVHSLSAYNFWIGEGFDRYGYHFTSPDIWPKAISLVAEKGGLERNEARDFYYPDLNPVEVAALEKNLQRAAVERIAKDPPGYLMRLLRGVYRFWVQAQSPARTLQYVLVMLPLTVVIIPLIGHVRELRDDLVFVLSVTCIILNNLAYAAVLPMARFSVQVYPELAWVLAAGVFFLLQALRSWGGRHNQTRL